MGKVCSVCRVDKPLEEFHVHRKTTDGRQGTCKPCAIARAMARNKANPEAFRRSQRTHRLRKIYGIDQAEYDAMFERQGGRCAICRRPPKSGRRLHVDHDHDTGKVRGLLCMPCNVFIGWIAEDVIVLKRAIAYLRGHATLF